ncbi:hypothetical protein C7447_1087 [Tenacibaculum adriaticum]|uniref:Circularly permuted ATP-grasp superfamily protein n=1 Tax=Tenacibaculum adriaticum TaxID=413713 RepID=A0A5S5DK15_9FLAO|nr:hypothetical protein [Tenacibaculum adriaticum]TYP96257.1 hypothetical protein C7447_1087 [Tenacibaculum adriaticum]
MKQTEVVKPNTFNSENHWYPKALNATIHPMVNFFLNLDKERIVTRYCHLHPKVDKEKLYEILSYECKYFLWGGADLINSTSADGDKNMVIIENNSCPSGQKSMPLLDDNKEDGSYRLFVERTFKTYVNKGKNQVKDGRLAVFYDKNYMETSGYAAVIADVFKEDVFLVPYFSNQENEHVKIEDGIFYLLQENEWVPLKAIFRYVTQKPWNRFPISSKTKILNPIITCLAGGRNKMVAAKAYDIYNTELEEYGMRINTPDTIWDVSKNEIPLWVQKLGGQAVIKVPYSNAGQGVYTIVNQQELDEFMNTEMEYERFIVQSLIGNYNWSSISKKGKYYHVGTMPNQKGETFVADFRMMVSSTKEGIKPLCMYSRRALLPLVDNLKDSKESWDILGTNLSVKLGDNQWTSDTNRLMIMDRRDYNKLGLGIDDLIETFIQTVLSTIAIDKMCVNLIDPKKKFKKKLFTSLNNDSTLLNEIY